MFEPLYTADEMRAAEQGHDVEALMERAGRAVADNVLRRYPDARRIAAVCGKGANGGDGRIALRVLAESGRETSEELEDDPDLVIDALFGTGFRGEPRQDAALLIERVNGAGVPVVAVDIPSGVDASTGEVPGVAVRADVTVTMHGRKVGLVVAPGRFHAGEIDVVDIGLEHADTEQRLVTDAVLLLVPRRSERDTKYTAGSVLVVGGSPGMTGAVCLAAEAAFRADAGYVAVAVAEHSLPVVGVEDLRPEHGIGGPFDLRVLNQVVHLGADVDGRAGFVRVSDKTTREPGHGQTALRRAQEKALPDLYARWERWAADVTESHTTYLPLVRFRSPRPLSSWVIALLAGLDSAALFLALSPKAAPTVPARLCLRAGFLCFNQIAQAMGIKVPEEPDPRRGITLTYQEFLDAIDRMREVDFPIERDPAEAWVDFTGWRVNYEQAAYALAADLHVVPALWSGERRPPTAPIPPIRPPLGRPPK